jgi:hypothetical protein
MRVTTWGVFALFPLINLGLAWSQEETAQEIQIPAHWSPYDAPTSYPEGTQLHIIVKGDTLWDLANQYFQNPFLWPQLWNANRYITNPHWIYPGDPLVIPELDVVRGAEEEAGAPGAPGAPGEPGAEPGAPGAPGPVGPTLIPATEEVSIQCAGYVTDKEDESLRVIGNEEGDGKISLATGDIVYINGGTADGVSPGDMFYLQRRDRKVDTGWQVTRTGWVIVLAAQERSAIAEITTACVDVRKEDYLLPFEQIPVPLIQPEAPATRLTPETGQLRGQIAASLDWIGSMGQGNMVSIDLGERDGVIPGNIFTIFRYLYKGVQRKMLGELVVLTVQEKTATAKISYSYDYIVTGDEIELK